MICEGGKQVEIVVVVGVKVEGCYVNSIRARKVFRFGEFKIFGRGRSCYIGVLCRDGGQARRRVRSRRSVATISSYLAIDSR
jgi:hypothetical protein